MVIYLLLGFSIVPLSKWLCIWFWVNCNMSLTRIEAMSGWFSSGVVVRSWSNLPRLDGQNHHLSSVPGSPYPPCSKWSWVELRAHPRSGEGQGQPGPCRGRQRRCVSTMGSWRCHENLPGNNRFIDLICYLGVSENGIYTNIYRYLFWLIWMTNMPINHWIFGP